MNIKKATEEYFEAFASKDISRLKQMYSPNIRLVDWLVDLTGRPEVLKANEELFKLDFTLEVKSIAWSLFNQSFNYIVITIGDEVLHVMDVITFEDGKILDITAYKR